ncbi:DUF4184 family protein [Micromonospora sp. NPDC049523]|uniref:DUF4184 family protein n=1 Tax=Micromonospora sp. NPDC049523 TaxID=3155921 RepID=UPI003432F760
MRHPWWVSTTSALVGAVSHIGWDAFTHPSLDRGRVAFPFLHAQVWQGVPWWEFLSTASDVFGFAASAALIVHIGRSRLLRR